MVLVLPKILNLRALGRDTSSSSYDVTMKTNLPLDDSEILGDLHTVMGETFPLPLPLTPNIKHTVSIIEWMRLEAE